VGSRSLRHEESSHRFHSPVLESHVPLFVTHPTVLKSVANLVAAHPRVLKSDARVLKSDAPVLAALAGA